MAGGICSTGLEPAWMLMAQSDLSVYHLLYGKFARRGLQNQMADKSERLTVLSDAEQFALYGLPDFDDRQRLTYLSLSGPELALASSRPGLHAQVWCALQIGYFKAKHAFFRFSWDDAQDDCTFRPDPLFQRSAVSSSSHYQTRTLYPAHNDRGVVRLPPLVGGLPHATRTTGRPNRAARCHAGFIVAELIAWLNEHKIVRPGHTTLQTLISEALSAERGRLGGLLAERLDESARQALAQMLVRDDTLSELAALKQDAKNFKWRQMANEREKRARLEPLYLIARSGPDPQDIREAIQCRAYGGLLSGAVSIGC